MALYGEDAICCLETRDARYVLMRVARSCFILRHARCARSALFYILLPLSRHEFFFCAFSRALPVYALMIRRRRRPYYAAAAASLRLRRHTLMPSRRRDAAFFAR